MGELWHMNRPIGERCDLCEKYQKRVEELHELALAAAYEWGYKEAQRAVTRDLEKLKKELGAAAS